MVGDGRGRLQGRQLVARLLKGARRVARKADRCRPIAKRRTISKDPVADSTDLYAFVSPDDPDTVTIIANYIPLEGPAGGPNFYEFGDDVLYEINIDNDGDGDADITYQFRFTTHVKNPKTFLYNTGPITRLDSAELEPPPDLHGHPGRRARQDEDHRRRPGLPALQHRAALDAELRGRSAQAAVHTLGGGIKVFAGQRREGFFVDLGSIFDLGDLRPFQNLHLIPTAAAPGVDATKDLNVHSSPSRSR